MDQEEWSRSLPGPGVKTMDDWQKYGDETEESGMIETARTEGETNPQGP